MYLDVFEPHVLYEPFIHTKVVNLVGLCYFELHRSEIHYRFNVKRFSAWIITDHRSVG